MNLPLLGSAQGFHFSLLSRLPFRGGLIAPWIVMEEFSKRWGSACHWLWAGATLAAFTPPGPLCVQEGENGFQKVKVQRQLLDGPDWKGNNFLIP